MKIYRVELAFTTMDGESEKKMTIICPSRIGAEHVAQDEIDYHKVAYICKSALIYPLTRIGRVFKEIGLLYVYLDNKWKREIF